ncbi:LysM peptidoglycan-binding domain-containing protein [Cellulomonas palmilytica]|uniref:LysM peptidoglycan-binding domain-containing protein n=1 Tax=Cellulomonas palmilytica TaxID=2608402 RepID=UPI001F1D2FC2|nr:LysM domain-containing protein [Cellulomonas palmilytica]
MTSSARRRPLATTAATLGVAALTAAGVAVALVLAALAAAHPDRPLAVQDVVNVAVAGLGAIVAAWLAVSCALGSACVAGRLVGAGWRSGEALLRRCAPVVVRRAVAGAVGASLGLGLVATGAHAAPVDPSPTALSVADEASTSTGAASRTGADGVAEGVLEGPAQAAGAVGSAGSVPVVAARDTGTAPQAPVGAPDPASPALTWQVTAPVPSDAGTPADTSPRDDTGPADGASPEPVATGWVPTTGTAAGGGDGRGDGSTDAAGASRLADDVSGQSASGATAPQALAGASGATLASAVAPAAAHGNGSAVVVVEAGDSLWSIAAAHLPHGASDAQVAAAWPRWYEANRDVVGDDPDVLLPGQVLTAPVTEVAR